MITESGEKIKILVMSLLLAFYCVLTYYFHAVLGTGTVFTHSFYIPIVLAAVWWRRKGVIVAVFLAVLLFLSHTFIRTDPQSINDYLWALMFLVVSLGVAELRIRIDRANEELRLHAAMMDNVTEGVYLIGLDDFLIKWTNDKFARMFGYDPGEMVGKQVDTVNAPTESTPAETRMSIVDILKETGEWHGEVRNIKRDGTHFWCYANVSLFDHPEYGNVIVSVHTDITERKQMEELIKDSEERLRGLSEAAFEAIFISEKGVCIEQNSAAEKMFGYTLSEAIGRKGTEWIAPEDREMVMHNMVSSYEEPYEATALRKDGSAFPAEIQGKMMHYKGRSVRVTALSDITERKRAEEALTLSNANFQQVVSNITTVVWKADIGDDGAFENTYSSPVVDELLELPAGTIQNDWDKYFSYIKPEYLEQVNNAFREAIISPGKRIDCEYEVLKDNGQTAWFHSTGRCFKKKGKLHVFGSTTDITEHKQAKIELQKRISELETFYRATLGREERVIELKQEVNELLEQLGKNKRYGDGS